MSGAITTDDICMHTQIGQDSVHECAFMCTVIYICVCVCARVGRCALMFRVIWVKCLKPEHLPVEIPGKMSKTATVQSLRSIVQFDIKVSF